MDHLGETFVARVTLRVKPDEVRPALGHDLHALLRAQCPVQTLPTEPTTGLTVHEAWWRILAADQLEMLLQVGATVPQTPALLAEFVRVVLEIAEHVGQPVPEALLIDTPPLLGGSPSSPPDATGLPRLVADLAIEDVEHGHPSAALFTSQQGFAEAVRPWDCLVLQDEGPSVIVDCAAGPGALAHLVATFAEGMGSVGAARLRCRLFATPPAGGDLGAARPS
ncbi:hypothetical protein ACQCX5_12460 [Propionibacteriaceae bacterium G57]|uniref:hypothetical protein n=1 Tax=Aestuariimicrobium sp. G57 TaxID=3418485 RepID=UPI003DA76F4E